MQIQSATTAQQLSTESFSNFATCFLDLKVNNKKVVLERFIVIDEHGNEYAVTKEQELIRSAVATVDGNIYHYRYTPDGKIEVFTTNRPGVYRIRVDGETIEAVRKQDT